jgi:hypothetical protein
MMTRRIFEGIIVVSVLLWPAKSTVKHWGRKQLTVNQPGSVMHGVGEVIVTVLQ